MSNQLTRSLAVAALAVAAMTHPLAQIDPKTALLERKGWDAIAAGDAHAAAEAFRDAIAGDPKNPQLLLGAGTAAYLERRDADAKEALVAGASVQSQAGTRTVAPGTGAPSSW